MIVNANNIIDQWFRELTHMANLNQDETIYNKAHASKEQLKKLLGLAEVKITESAAVEPAIENITTNEEIL